MAEKRVQRRLAAILAADVVGYSRLMGEDETGTLAQLKAHRKDLIDPKIAEHHGRIVKLMGDGALVEFPSVVEAVQCAVEIQPAMAERNTAIPEDRRIEFRLGIHVGDISVEGDDSYGDGGHSASGERAGSGLLGRVREIRDLESEVAELDAAVEAQDAEQSGAQAARARASDELENLRNRHHTAALAVANHEKDLERTQERVKALGESHEGRVAERSQRLAGRNALLEERELLEQQLEETRVERGNPPGGRRSGTACAWPSSARPRPSVRPGSGSLAGSRRSRPPKRAARSSRGWWAIPRRRSKRCCGRWSRLARATTRSERGKSK